jgi:hypothetical protein
MPKGKKTKEIIPQIIKKSVNTKIIIIAIIVIIIALVPSIYFYSKYSQSQKLLQNQNGREASALIEQVSKLIEFPKNEVPTIATVTDKAKLADQDFFANSQNGDKVLIFSLAKKAILYRPSINKIIEVAPINVGDQAQTPSASSSPSATPTPNLIRIALYNGTSTVGLTAKAEKQIKAKLTDVKITVKDSADKDDYTKTLIIDQTGRQNEIAGKVADVLEGKVSSINQTKLLVDYKNADILVILGEDYR